MAAMFITGAFEVCQPSAPDMRSKVRLHFEPARLGMAPPSFEAGHLGFVGMPLMNKGSCGAAGPAIQVFVSAPTSEVHVPVVELQGNVARGMGQSRIHRSLQQRGLRR